MVKKKSSEFAGQDQCSGSDCLLCPFDITQDGLVECCWELDSELGAGDTAGTQVDNS